MKDRPYLLCLFVMWNLCILMRLCFAQPAAPSEKVTLRDGRRLALHCEGTGAPSIVLEAGYGSDSLSWRRLQPLLAKHNRVCSYDRAGERVSTPGPYPRDINAMVADLHELALVANFHEPFVLVGHSMGGMTALLYTERYRADVSALVLLDPGMSGMLKAYESLPSTKRSNDEVIEGLIQLSRCRTLASEPSRKAELLSACSWRDLQLTEQQNEERDRMIEQPAFWETMLSTDLALRAPQTVYRGYLKRFADHQEGPMRFTPRSDETLDERELRIAEKSLGNMPLVIVSVDSSPADRQAWAIKRRQYQIKATNLSKKGKVIDMSQTSHNVQLDQPARVVDIVLSVVEAIKPKAR